MTIVEFINARLDEAESAARAELELQERLFPAGECTVEYAWSRLTRHTSGGSGSAFVPGAPSPAWVIADVNAKRGILDLHSALDARRAAFSEHDLGTSHTEAGLESYDHVLRHLAAVNSDHPDYREEWRP